METGLPVSWTGRRLLTRETFESGPAVRRRTGPSAILQPASNRRKPRVFRPSLVVKRFCIGGFSASTWDLIRVGCREKRCTIHLEGRSLVRMRMMTCRMATPMRGQTWDFVTRGEGTSFVFGRRVPIASPSRHRYVLACWWQVTAAVPRGLSITGLGCSSSHYVEENLDISMGIYSTEIREPPRPWCPGFKRLSISRDGFQPAKKRSLILSRGENRILM